MSTELEQQQITRIISQLESALALLRQFQKGIPTEQRVIVSLEKYYSSSGNTTWRGRCDDIDTVIYLRQAQHELFKEAGIWEQLNDLEYDETIGCMLRVETIRDGDFHKIVSITSDFLLKPEA